MDANIKWGWWNRFSRYKGRRSNPQGVVNLTLNLEEAAFWPFKSSCNIDVFRGHLVPNSYLLQIYDWLLTQCSVSWLLAERLINGALERDGASASPC